MMNVLLKLDLNSLGRRHPERSRFSGEADLPQNSFASIATAAKSTTNPKPLPNDSWPLAAGTGTNQ